MKDARYLESDRVCVHCFGGGGVFSWMYATDFERVLLMTWCLHINKAVVKK